MNLVAIAEQRIGAARDEDDFFLLWSDAGIGSAVMLGGRIHRGSTGGAGEIAFLLVPGVPIVRNPVREDHGGFDDLAGAGAIVELASQHGIPGSSASEMVALASRTPNSDFLDELAERFAYGLASMVALIDPPAIVLAGSIMKAGGQALADAIRAQLDIVSIRSPRVVLGQVTDEPVIAGALLVSLEITRDGAFST